MQKLVVALLSILGCCKTLCVGNVCAERKNVFAFKDFALKIMCNGTVFLRFPTSLLQVSCIQ